EEKKYLLFLSSRLGSDQYLSLAKEYANINDFLNTFKSCHPSLECILLHSPLLSPRAYSICSYKKNSIEFIISLNSYQTPEPASQRRIGICSRYFSEKFTQIPFEIWIKPRPPTSFRLSRDISSLNSLSLIMICAGAGLSPFIG